MSVSSCDQGESWQIPLEMMTRHLRDCQTLRMKISRAISVSTANSECPTLKM